MRSVINIFIQASLCVFILSGCDTRRKIVERFTSDITIEIDWSAAQLEKHHGTSIWIFPHKGGSPIVVQTQDASETVKLPMDSYSFLVFNEDVDTHEFIDFSGTDRYETFKAHVKTLELPARYNKADGTNAASSPNVLAVDRLGEYQVTREMTSSSERHVIKFKPQRVVTLITVIADICGMDNTAVTGHALSVSGLADGLNLSTLKATGGAVTHIATLNDRRYHPGSISDGTMTARFYSFGRPEGTIAVKAEGVPNIATMFFKMRGKMPNDTYYHDPIETEVSQHIRDKEVLESAITIYLETVMLPYVPDENDPGAGFDADISDWGDEIVTEIPI